MSATLSPKRLRKITLLMPVGFALAGALSRFALPWVETRFQILWFGVAALWAQFFVQNASRDKVGIRLLVLNGMAAVVAILLVKFALEGLPIHAGEALIGRF